MATTSMTAARLLSLVVLITVLGISPAAAASPSAYEKQVVKATNTYRSTLGKVTVRHQSCVDRQAEKQARWMADRQVLAHRKGQMRKILTACKLTGVSENIAWNFGSGAKAVSAWRKSPGHAKNLRAPKMRHIGVGAVRDADGQWWVAQVFGTRK